MFIILIRVASSASLFATFVVTLIVIFIVSSYGVFVGVKQAWPRSGQDWRWKRAWLMIASAIVLTADVAYGVAWYIALLDGGD